MKLNTLPYPSLHIIKSTLEKLILEVLTLFLHEKIQIDEESFSHSLLQDLGNEWSQYLEKIFVLELHQAKQADFLKGDTPEQRYQHFLELLSLEENSHFLVDSRYFIISEKLKIFSKHYINYFHEFCQRFLKDRKEIAKQFNLLNFDEAQLIAFNFKGDPHANLKRVAIIGFRLKNLDKKWVVYKPRSIYNESFFNDNVVWLNQRLSLTMLEIQYIKKNEYGWCECIEKKDCQSKEELSQFYYRFGLLTVLVYILGISDMHFENIIASGAHPAIIDFECYGLSFNELMSKHYHHSVLASGMLPYYYIERNSFSDISAFSGGGTECEIPFENSCMENTGTDEVKMVRKSGYFQLQNNRPTCFGKAARPSDYKSEVMSGFLDAYQIFLKEKNQWKHQFLSELNNLTLRVVMRPTATYLKLITESYHPTLLKNRKQFKKHFNWLKDNLPAFHASPQDCDKIVASEMQQIENHDIPLFKFEKGKVLDGCNHVIALVNKSIERSIIEKIDYLSDADMTAQLNLIEKGIDTYSMNYPNKAIDSTVAMTEKMPLTDVLLEEKIKQKIEYLLTHLLKNCFKKNELFWPEHTKRDVNDKSFWTLDLSNPFNLYSGSLGVIFVLSEACDLLNNAHFSSFLDHSLCSYENYLAKLPSLKEDKFIDFSLFQGIGGLLYISAMNCNKQNTKKQKYLDIIGSIFKLMDDYFLEWLETYQFDIISGISGLLLVLDGMIKNNIMSEKTKYYIKICQDFFLTHYPIPSKIPKKAKNKFIQRSLLGFSHGVSGMAYALLRTQDYSNNKTAITKWVKSALAYERRHFDLHHQGWENFISTDFRQMKNSENIFQDDWCHGSLGIGFSRLELKKLGWKDNCIDYEIAVSTLVIKNAKVPHTINYCHGHLGRYEFLKRLNEEKLVSDQYFLNEKEKLLEKIFSCDILFPTENDERAFIPGLMIGYAGIIHALLTLIEKNKCQNILIVENRRAHAQIS